MIEQLKAWDEQFLLFLNQFHMAGLDPIMYIMTKTEFWTPLYLFLIYLIFKIYKNEGWIILLGITLSIVLSDQFTTSFMKPFFQRLRPSHEPSLVSLLHLVADQNGNFYYGGLYGFASSHAANTAGVAFFLFLLFRNTYRWIWTIFIWAFIMSYTRIYLGVHYPGDILAGVMVGILSGWAGFRFHQWLRTKFNKKTVTPPTT